jgi:hypothetical protein
VGRQYLNGYVPKLQTSGEVVQFLFGCRGKRIPSPALLGKPFDAPERGKATAGSQGLGDLEKKPGSRTETDIEISVFDDLTSQELVSFLRYLI